VTAGDFRANEADRRVFRRDRGRAGRGLSDCGWRTAFTGPSRSRIGAGFITAWLIGCREESFARTFFLVTSRTVFLSSARELLWADAGAKSTLMPALTRKILMIHALLLM
jgi:hypothetical protein